MIKNCEGYTMAKENCSKCDKEIGWLSQNKIDGALYCDDCAKELKKAKKESAKREKKGAAKEEKEGENKAPKREKKTKKVPKKEAKKAKASVKHAKGSGATLQQFVLIATACILVFMLLFPPFYCFQGGEKATMGNFSVFSPPTLPTKTMEAGLAANMDALVLFVQYLFVITIGGILWLALQRREARAEPSLPEQSPIEAEQMDENSENNENDKPDSPAE
ncbi:MAG: hypothetical protein JRL30_25285 [Deltaproteobacteria bacterium]|nr:hypothetical protein [Deltaproteobacteria bacterium]